MRLLIVRQKIPMRCSSRRRVRPSLIHRKTQEAALTSSEGSHARSDCSLSYLTLTPKCVYVRILGGHAAIHVLAFIP